MALHPTFARILDPFMPAEQQEAQQARCRPEGECAYCDEYRGDPMMPSHTASKWCESGKRPHCTCDVCF